MACKAREHKRRASFSRGWWIPVLLKALPPSSLISGARASSAACLRQVTASSGSLQSSLLYQYVHMVCKPRAGCVSYMICECVCEFRSLSLVGTVPHP